MDIVDFLETEVEKLGWQFSYGNKDNQNLLTSDLTEDEIYFLLDPVVESEGVSEFGGSVDIEYSGTFIICVKSDLDDIYQGRYNKNIKPLKTSLNLLKDVIDCSDYERQLWRKDEVINELDVNFDGLIITYRLKLL